MPHIFPASFTFDEDNRYVFVSSDFSDRYSDPEGDSLVSIRITTIPIYGALLLGDVTLSAGYPVSFADIAAGLLRFVPPFNANGAGIDAFSFVAVDSNGEEDSAQSAFTFNMTAVNDAPTFFHGDGMVVVPMEADSSDDTARSVRVLADGRIVVAGSTVGSDGMSRVAVVRCNSDGILDTAFGDEGKVTTAIGLVSDCASSMAMQADGKIVVAGHMVKSATDSDFAVVRYNSDGSLDTAFSSDGKVTSSMGSRSDYATAIAVQPDGKVVVAGYTVTNDDFTDSDFAVARYQTDGSLDKGFSSDGKTTSSLGTMVAEAYGMALQSDGKIVVTGFVTQSETDSDFAVVRYDTSGTLDKTFSGDGKMTTSLGDWQDVARSVALQADGKIVVAGYSFVTESDSDFAVVRYNENGSLDMAFGDEGMVRTQVGSSTDSACRVVVLGDGRILVAGFAWNGYDRDIALVRYNIDGSLDTTFDGDGVVITHAGTIDQDALDMVVQPDGRIVVATSLRNGSDNDFMLLRFNPDGTLDRSFDPLDTLGSTVSYVEGNGPGVSGTPVVLDPDVQIFDVELEAAGCYKGATLSLLRQGGASVDDRFFATSTLGDLVEGTELTIDGMAIGTVTTNSSGTLQLDFGAAATGELVSQIMQRIAYANTSDAPPSEVLIGWNFSDGDVVNPQHTTGCTTVSITGVNDAPTSTDTHVSIPCNEEKVLEITDFGVYDDPEGSALSEVKITALPEYGALLYTNDGTTWHPVTQDQEIETQDIEAGHLKYQPEAAQTSITVGFLVSDGSLCSESAYTLTVDVQQPQYMDFGINIEYGNNGEGIEGVTAKLTRNASGLEVTATDNGNGQYRMYGLVEGDYTLSLTREVDEGDSDAINVDDSLAALDLALGHGGSSPYQYLAADIDRDGTVGFRDALGILKMALHRQDAPEPEWAFVPASTGSEPMSSDNVNWPDDTIPVTLDQDKEIDLVGVLLGDVVLAGLW